MVNVRVLTNSGCLNELGSFLKGLPYILYVQGSEKMPDTMSRQLVVKVGIGLSRALRLVWITCLESGIPNSFK